MKFKNLLIITNTILVILFSGCATKSIDPKIAMKPPAYVEQLPSKEIQAPFTNEGSLFGRGDNPLFSDRKAMHVNDLVTVVINENVIQSSTTQKALSKNNSDQLGGGIFTGGGNSAINNLANKVTGITNTGFKTDSQNSFSSKGTDAQNEQFTTTISARVIKILNNGNYFIEGSREMLINGEKQIIEISGVIRPYDIDETNTINSKYIADAKILYKTEGDMTINNKKGWATKIIEGIWPF